MAKALAGRLEGWRAQHETRRDVLLAGEARDLWDRINRAPDEAWYIDDLDEDATSSVISAPTRDGAPAPAAAAVLVLDATDAVRRLLDQVRPHPHPGPEELKDVCTMLAQQLFDHYLEESHWFVDSEVREEGLECFITVCYEF